MTEKLGNAEKGTFPHPCLFDLIVYVECANIKGIDLYRNSCVGFPTENYLNVGSFIKSIPFYHLISPYFEESIQSILYEPLWGSKREFCWKVLCA